MSGKPLAVGIEVIQDLSEISAPTEGFLRRYRHRVKTRLSDGTRTDTYVVDYVDRPPHKRDAVGIVAFARGESPDETLILLRRQVRYAAYIAAGSALTCEMVAGILELPESVEACAQRELYEETGVEVGLERIRQLGRPFFILPGTMTERIFPVTIELDRAVLEGAVKNDPPGDGSPFEQGAEVIALSLGEALGSIRGKRSGATPDIMNAVTELVLRRAHEALSEGSL